MASINYALKEISCKVVYYGPGMCGKTTNLQVVYDQVAEDARGRENTNIQLAPVAGKDQRKQELIESGEPP